MNVLRGSVRRLADSVCDVPGRDGSARHVREVTPSPDTGLGVTMGVACGARARQRSPEASEEDAHAKQKIAARQRRDLLQH